MFTNKKKVISINCNQLFSSLPVKLFLVIVISLLLEPFLPNHLKSMFLTISLFIREITLFILPVIVFFLVFFSFSQLSKNFIIFTGLLILLVCISNFLSLIIVYPIGILTQEFISSAKVNISNSDSLTPYLIISLPKVCSNITALFFGMSLGIYAGSNNTGYLKTIAKEGYRLVNLLLSRIFIPILPIFISGFILKSQHDGLITILFKNFIPLLLIISTVYILHIGSLYMISKNFIFNDALHALKNILPATLIGFSSMSSAAAMPILVDGSAKNVKDQNLPRRIVPFITNTHMIGDALAIPLIAISLYTVEYGHMPSMYKYLIFSLSYVLTKFASAGIPGGTILIMTPVLESKLGFTSEMSSVILTIYLLFDPLCTSGSILGNGVFVMIFEKIKNFFKIYT